MTDIRRMTTSAWRLRAGMPAFAGLSGAGRGGNHVPAIGAGVRPCRGAGNGMQDDGSRVSAPRSAM